MLNIHTHLDVYSLLAMATGGHLWSSIAVDAAAAAAAAKSLQSCPTPCDPIDGSPPDSPVPGILQARTLEWVAISFSNAWKWKVKVKLLSHVRLLSTPWTAAHQAPPSMWFAIVNFWILLMHPTLGFSHMPSQFDQKIVILPHKELYVFLQTCSGTFQSPY